ncbi:hypothetical protein ACFYMW_10870 [Streptomyces sp. NPDC006692]|uniref:hypothetical protein n=1 Tax=Streptomyces sp. NPDC006692 TaxID=3364758 RepID=UPI0036754A55
MRERAVLDALAAVLAEAPPVSYGWTESLWDLFEAYENHRSGRGPAPQLTAEQADRFAAQWRRQECSAQAHRLLGQLCVPAGRAGLAAPAEAAGLAVRLVRADLAAHAAVNLLYALGAGHGEPALRALVRDGGIGDADRLRARERLFTLRRDGYRARGEQAPEGEEPLLPSAVRQLLCETGRVLALPLDFGRVRTALEALLPSTPLATPEPPPERAARWDDLDADGERRPDWLEIRLLVWGLMPTADRVTRERMAEAERECELLGLDGGEGFEVLWTTRLAAWLAEEIFDALSRGPDPAPLTPWAMDLAGQYIERGMAAESARGFLRRTEDEAPYSGEVFRRLNP